MNNTATNSLSLIHISRNKNISSGRETSWEEKNEKPFLQVGNECLVIHFITLFNHSTYLVE